MHGNAKIENKLLKIKNLRGELCLRFNRRISELEKRSTKYPNEAESHLSFDINLGSHGHFSF